MAADYNGQFSSDLQMISSSLKPLGPRLESLSLSLSLYGLSWLSKLQAPSSRVQFWELQSSRAWTKLLDTLKHCGVSPLVSASLLRMRDSSKTSTSVFRRMSVGLIRLFLVLGMICSNQPISSVSLGLGSRDWGKESWCAWLWWVLRDGMTVGKSRRRACERETGSWIGGVKTSGDSKAAIRPMTQCMLSVIGFLL